MKVWSYRDAILKGKMEPNTKLVLLTLSVHMSEQGDSCFPSIETLMAETALARATILKHIEIAIELGYIIKKKHGFAGKRWRRNEYFACYPEGSSLARPPCEEGGSLARPPSPAKVVQPVDEGGSMDSVQVVQQLNSNSPYNSPYKNTPLPPKGDRPVHGTGQEDTGQEDTGQEDTGQNSGLFSEPLPKDSKFGDQFSQIYEAYPRKEKRKRAETSFARALKRASFEIILTGVKRYAEARRGENPKYTSLLSSWLNGDEWNDWAAKPAETDWEKNRRLNEELFPGSNVHL